MSGCHRRQHRPLAAIAACLTLTAACGTGTSTAQGPDGTTTLTISNPANVSNVPLHIAMEQGLFAAERLAVKADVDLGSGSTVEAVVGGQVDMAWTNVVSAIGVYGKGLGIKLVAVTDIGTEGSQQVLVPKGSPVNGIADLAGKKLAVLSPNTVCILSVKAALRQLGLPEDAITFTPVAPPEHANVLSGGEVAATCTSDPFRTLMIEKLGARSVFETSQGELTGYPVGGYVVSERFAQQNQAALVAFRRALHKATQYANANPDAVRASLPKFTTVDADVASRVVINKYVEAKDSAGAKDLLQRTSDAMRNYGMLDKHVDMAGFVLPG